MQIKMSVGFLIPGVQRINKSEFSAEVILPEGQKGLRGGFEQDREHDLLFVQHNGIENMRQYENDMEVIGGKNFCFSLFKPTFARHMLACVTVSIAA